MKISEILREAHINQQLSRYHPNTKTYRGEPLGGDLDNPQDLWNQRQQADWDDEEVHGREASPEYDDPIEDVARSELKRHMAEILDQLPERQQQVIRMIYWAGLELPEVAERMHMSPERVRQIQARALRKFKHPKASGKIRQYVGDGPGDNSDAVIQRFYSMGWRDGHAGDPQNSQVTSSDEYHARMAYSSGYTSGERARDRDASEKKHDSRISNQEHNQAVSSGNAYGGLRGVKGRDVNQPLNKPRANPSSTGNWEYGKNGRY
jgi:RNA polymerase sigma factor (sigma-70 family)